MGESSRDDQNFGFIPSPFDYLTWNMKLILSYFNFKIHSFNAWLLFSYKIGKALRRGTAV